MSAVTLLLHFAHLKQSTWKKDWLGGVSGVGGEGQDAPERDDEPTGLVYGGALAAGTEPVLDVDERGRARVLEHDRRGKQTSVSTLPFRVAQPHVVRARGTRVYKRAKETTVAISCARACTVASEVFTEAQSFADCKLHIRTRLLASAFSNFWKTLSEV